MLLKDDYQEHMLGYIDGVRVEFEGLIHFQLQQYEVNAFYTNLDIAFERLWNLIGASDVDWEAYRSALETSCDELLRALHPLPNAKSLVISGISFYPISSLALTGTV